MHATGLFPNLWSLPLVKDEVQIINFVAAALSDNKIEQQQNPQQEETRAAADENLGDQSSDMQDCAEVLCNMAHIIESSKVSEL